MRCSTKNKTKQKHAISTHYRHAYKNVYDFHEMRRESVNSNDYHAQNKITYPAHFLKINYLLLMSDF